MDVPADADDGEAPCMLAPCLVQAVPFGQVSSVWPNTLPQRRTLNFNTFNSECGPKCQRAW